MIFTALPGSNDPNMLIPKIFNLKQNYPNPFNPTTTITYTLAKANYVKIRIYDQLGALIRTMDPGKQNTGEHSWVWDGKNDKLMSVSSGIYYYELEAGSFRDVKRMVVLK